MFIRPNRNFIPDGFSGQRPGAQKFFAASGTASAGSGEVAEPRRRRASDHEQYHHNQDGYDEGLVHSHGWAASDF